MLIVIDLAHRAVSLSGVDVFDRFSVEVLGGESDDVLAAVVGESGLGRIHPDGTHVVIDPASVRVLAGAAVTPEWEAGFEGMSAYAAGKGWVEADGGILAHIEWHS